MKKDLKVDFMQIYLQHIHLFRLMQTLGNKTCTIHSSLFSKYVGNINFSLTTGMIFYQNILANQDLANPFYFSHKLEVHKRTEICVRCQSSARFAAAIAEMLVQSDETNLLLLPALPRDKWPSGCVSGLKARGHVSVAICWQDGELHKVGLLVNNQNSTRRLHYSGMSVTVNLCAGYFHMFNRDLKRVRSVPLTSSEKMSKPSCCIS
jgi:hypothetical protein